MRDTFRFPFYLEPMIIRLYRFNWYCSLIRWDAVHAGKAVNSHAIER